MKINFDIESNFDDFFNSSVLYWETASTEEMHREINYKKALIFLGASIELALLLLVKEKTDHSIIKENRETISFAKACHFLRERNMIFSYIDTCFFPANEKATNQDDCLSTIKALRDKLLHNHGEIDTSEADNNIAHSILVLNYIMLPLDRVLVSECQKREWLLKSILSATEWADISPTLSKRLSNEISLDKDNYFDYPDFDHCQTCPNCACKGAVSILAVKDKGNTCFQGQCTICLHRFDIQVCGQCNAGFDESVLIYLNEEDLGNIICENCYDSKFKN